MYLYYTTISGSEQIQTNHVLSLGGFKSATRLPNGKFNNLFSDISQFSVANYNQNTYVGLVLKNETGAAIQNINLYFGYPAGSYSKLRIAAVTMVADSAGNLQMEHIMNNVEKPLYAEFYEADGEANKVNLGALAIGAQIGLWIERELLIEVIKADQENVYELVPGYTDRYQEKELAKEDDIKINISWDVTP